MFNLLCTIEMDFSHLKLEPRYRYEGGRIVSTYYQLDYSIVMSFGLTELKAQIAWMENVCRFASNFLEMD